MSMNPRLLRPLATIDPDAVAWRNAVVAAGSSVSGSVVDAVSRFVKGCKVDGIWDAMKSVVLLAGADTLAGALAPMKGTAPTSYNFASGDYSKTSGLKGNGSSTYLDSNRNNNADPQDHSHNAVFCVTAATSLSGYLGSGAGVSGGNQIAPDFSLNLMNMRNRRNVGSGSAPAGYQAATGFIGHSRSASSQYGIRISNTSLTAVLASETPAAANITAFRLGSFGLYSDARLSFYSIGEAVDLALLDARVSALMTAIGVS